MRLRRTTAVISPNILRTPQSVKLGRLVLNIRDPAEEFLDIQLNNPSIIEFDGNFPLRYESAKSNTTLGSTLGRLLNSTYSNSTNTDLNIVASQQRVYQLPNAELHLREACGTYAQVRAWLTERAKASQRVYMIVGYHTLTNPEIQETIGTRRSWSSGVDPSTLLAPGEQMDALTTATVVNQQVLETTKHFSASGERVWAVQYRKILFKSTRKLLNGASPGGTLLRDNQWEVLWSRRGVEDDRFLLEVDLEGKDNDSAESDDNTPSSVEQEFEEEEDEWEKYTEAGIGEEFLVVLNDESEEY